jgi:hypothetical protein
MRALLFCLIFVASSASAETLRMKRVESTNLHMANGAGAHKWSWDYAITLELGSKGKVRVISTGKRREHRMEVINNRSDNTEERAAWTTTWQGTWTKGKTLELALELVKHDCKGEKEDNNTTTVAPCRTPTAQAAITCTSDQIDVENTARTKSAKAAAWICSLVGEDTELAESSGPWVFAKRGCVTVHGGKMTPSSFAGC